MQRLFQFARQTMPRISSTERIALESGTAGIEKHAFAGTLNHETLAKYVPHELTSVDNTMLSRVPALLETIDEYDIMTKRHTAREHAFWDHAKAQQFFGLIVPSEHGGMPMSCTGLSRLLQRLASCSASASVHVMGPASLGPAELLTHYGTSEQQQKFLPKI